MAKFKSVLELHTSLLPELIKIVKHYYGTIEQELVTFYKNALVSNVCETTNVDGSISVMEINCPIAGTPLTPAQHFNHKMLVHFDKMMQNYINYMHNCQLLDKIGIQKIFKSIQFASRAPRELEYKNKADLKKSASLIDDLKKSASSKFALLINDLKNFLIQLYKILVWRSATNDIQCFEYQRDYYETNEAGYLNGEKSFIYECWICKNSKRNDVFTIDNCLLHLFVSIRREKDDACVIS